MNEKNFQNLITSNDSGGQAMWSAEELKEINVKIAIVEKMLNKGFLIFSEEDSVYCGPITFEKFYSIKN